MRVIRRRVLIRNLVVLGLALLAAPWLIRRVEDARREQKFLDDLAAAVARAAEPAHESVIRIPDPDGVNWHRLFVFGPYTAEATIDGCCGLNDPVSDDSDVSHNDSVNLLVFCADGRVVWHIDIRRDIVDFRTNQPEDGVSRDTALFRITVRKDGWKEATWQEPVPAL